MKNIQNLTIDINKKPFQSITANTGEVASRFIRITILDNNIPIDLTGVTAYLYAKKPDNTKVFNKVIIENEINGIILAELTSQALVIEGSIILTLLLVKDNAKLCSKQFLLKVDNCIVDDKAIESTNEFTALTETLSQINDWNNYFEEASGKIEEKYTERLNDINTQLNYVAKTIEVSVTDFGAKGDGVTDDTEAFKKANEYIWNLAYNTYTPNTVMDRQIKLVIPNGIYKVTGDKVLGSVRSELEFINVKTVGYIVEGNGSTLLWNITDEDDRLFYLDYTVNAPNISNLRIFTINEFNPGTSGTIFSIESIKDNTGVWKSACSNGRYINIATCSGRNSTGKGNRCKHIFRLIGENMCDQSLVENCNFTYFKSCFYCENSQAVNWTFIRNGFFGAYTDTIYFKFTQMNDNFNVHMNSFSLHDGQTVLECISDVDTNGKLIERPDYNFSFVDNRMEVYHSGEYNYLNVCKMNFGRMYMARSNFNLASGAGNVRQQFLISGHGSYILDTCDLVNPLFTISRITDTTVGIGNSDYMGATIRDCMYIRGYDVKLCNDNFDIEDIIPSLLNQYHYLRVMRVSNLRKLNSITSTDFVVSATTRNMSQANQKEWSFYPTMGDLSMGYYIQLPPFSTITNIELTNMGTLPNEYKTIRVYFGDKSNNKYIDVENISPSIVPKTKLTLFDGFASIIDEDISNQKIFMCVVKDTGEEVTIGGSVKVTVMPLNIRFLGTVEAGIHIKENNTNKSIFVGSSSYRPSNPYTGELWFDTSLGKPIWFNGSNWIDSTGIQV